MDDLGRVAHLDAGKTTAQDVLVGVELVERKILKELESAGLERVGEVGVLTVSLFVAGVTYMLVPLMSNALLLGVVAFLLGLGLGCAQPLTILLTYNHAPPGRSGEALGLRLTANKLTQIAVPVVFGGLGSAFGLFPVFWANGVFLLAGGFVSLAERRFAAKKDAAAIITEQEEEDTT